MLNITGIILQRLKVYYGNISELVYWEYRSNGNT